jgi:flagellar L-ring protein precursor FlgH
MNRISSIIVAVAVAGLSACASVPDSIIQQPLTVKPQQIPPSPPVNGAIFQAAAYRPMFEDTRARLVGDTLTIVMVEKTSAGKSDGTSNSKSGSVDASVTGLLGLPASVLNRLNAGAANSNKLDEKTAATTSNTFTGTMGVTVTEVLPNGNLVVAGEKQIAFDKGVEFVRFSGVVNPTTIVSGNVVQSTQVADAKLEYRTNSRLDKTELMSQMARFFFSFLPI